MLRFEGTSRHWRAHCCLQITSGLLKAWKWINEQMWLRPTVSEGSSVTTGSTAIHSQGEDTELFRVKGGSWVLLTQQDPDPPSVEGATSQGGRKQGDRLRVGQPWKQGPCCIQGPVTSTRDPELFLTVESACRALSFSPGSSQ